MTHLLKHTAAVLDTCVAPRDVRIADGIITDLAPSLSPMDGERVTDLGGNYLFPGFIDTHMHGAAGCVFTNSDDDFNKITAYEASRGVTAITPTIGARPDDVREDSIRRILAAMRRGTVGAKLCGIHAEGPFLNPVRRGSMREENMRPPTLDGFSRLYDLCEGELKILSVAPEMDGALAVIREAARRGISVSAGHTDASFDEMLAGIDAGITRMTHTFNASRPLSHREPGVLGAALTDPRVTCEVICDFAHLHRSVVEMIYKLKGSRRFTAVSDASFCAGLPDGDYVAEGAPFTVSGGVSRHPDGTISGSAGDLLLAAKHLRMLGAPLFEIADMTARTPAEALGISDRVGRIAVGYAADFAVLDGALDIQKTYVDGICVFDALGAQ